MQTQTRRKQQAAQAAERRQENRSVKRAGNLLLAGLLLSLAYYWWLEPEQLGGNRTYDILVHYTPVLLGVLCLVAWLRADLAAAFTNRAARLRDKLLLIIFVPFLGAMGGYCTIGLLFRAGWDGVNAIYTSRQPIERNFADVHAVSTRRGAGVDIAAKGYYKTLRAPYSLLKANQTRDRGRFLVDIKLRPGLLDTWIVEDWQLVERP